MPATLLKKVLVSIMAMAAYTAVVGLWYAGRAGITQLNWARAAAEDDPMEVPAADTAAAEDLELTEDESGSSFSSFMAKFKPVVGPADVKDSSFRPFILPKGTSMLVGKDAVALYERVMEIPLDADNAMAIFPSNLLETGWTDSTWIIYPKLSKKSRLSATGLAHLNNDQPEDVLYTVQKYERERNYDVSLEGGMAYSTNGWLIPPYYWQQKKLISYSATRTDGNDKDFLEYHYIRVDPFGHVDFEGFTQDNKGMHKLQNALVDISDRIYLGDSLAHALDQSRLDADERISKDRDWRMADYIVNQEITHYEKPDGSSGWGISIFLFILGNAFMATVMVVVEGAKATAFIPKGKMS